VTQVFEGTLRRLVEYSWPGNVRELQNVIERGVILSPSNLLVLDREFSLAGDEARAATVAETLESIISGASSLPGISNNVRPVKHFLSRLLSFHLKEFFSFVFFLLSVDDHGSPVIFRSVSVRPKHLFDQNFDHDYYCKLPLAKERDAHSLGRRF
jgi:hypothetical protein